VLSDTRPWGLWLVRATLTAGVLSIPQCFSNSLDKPAGAAVSSPTELHMPLVGLVIVCDCDQGRWCKPIAAPQL
jgi:hypothetical protein